MPYTRIKGDVKYTVEEVKQLIGRLTTMRSKLVDFDDVAVTTSVGDHNMSHADELIYIGRQQDFMAPFVEALDESAKHLDSMIDVLKNMAANPQNYPGVIVQPVKRRTLLRSFRYYRSR